MALLASQQLSRSAAGFLLAKAGKRSLERAEGNSCDELPRTLKAHGVLFTAGEKLFSKDSRWRSYLAFGRPEAGDS